MKKTISVVAIIFFIFIVSLFFIIWKFYLGSFWIPVKYAVKPEDVDITENTIFVKEAWVTDGEWYMTRKGNEECSQYIFIDGNEPYTASIGSDDLNTFVCVYDYVTEKEIGESTGHIVKCYHVTEWYPLYPVKHEDRLLPSWCYPKNYLSKGDYN